MINLKTLIYLIFTISQFSVSADEPKEKQPLTPEQIQNEKQRIDEYYKTINRPKIQCAIPVDSVIKCLGFNNSSDDSCLDRDCNITKTEFNNHLNACEIYSLQNMDSIRTLILFRLLVDKFIKIQSSNITIDSNFIPTAWQDSSCDFYSFKIILSMSSDVNELTNALKDISGSKSIFTKPIEIIHHNLTGNKSIIFDYLFKIEKRFLDFPIPKSVIDSATENKWIKPQNSNFGFYSFKIIGKKKCYPEYSSLLNFNSHIGSSDTLDNVSKFIMSDADTLIVKFWSKPAKLTDSGKISVIDTSKLSFARLPDCQLPYNIQNLIREQYYKNGTLYFNNFRNDYCIWSLKIEKHIKDSTHYSKDILNNYLFAKKALAALETVKGKYNYQIESLKRSIYIRNLHKINRANFSSESDTTRAFLLTVTATDLQIQRSAFKWIKDELVFGKNKVSFKYLPQKITQGL